MSNPIESTTPGRPRPVTVARLLSFTIAALLVLAGIAFVQALLSVKATVIGADVGYTDADLSRAQHLLVGVAVVFFILVAAGHLTAGVLIGQKRNAGRILAWIIDGATVACCGCGLATAIARPGVQSAPTDTNASIKFESTSSGLTDILVLAAAAVAIIGGIAVIILLALPQSNEYFRKTPEPVWTPPGYGGVAQPPPFPGQYLPPPPSVAPPPSGPRFELPPPPPGSSPGAGAPPPPGGPTTPPQPNDPTAPPSDRR